jgi:hypothetical protein
VTGVWLLPLLGLAHAQSPCPEPRPLLGSAENDALNYYLADAKAGLVQVVDAWACGPRATPAELGLYFRVRGLLAYLDADEALAKRAFATAKAHGATFSPDYGTEVQALWDAAALPEGAPTELALKGRGDAEWLAIDGVDGDPPVPQGYHLLQVGHGDRARAARVIDATGASLTVAFAVAPPPAPEADDAPEPEAPAVEPVGPPSVATPAPPVPMPSGTDEGQPEPTGQAATAVRAPFLRERGPRYVDAAGTPVHWRDDLMPMAGRDTYGQRARRRFRSNPVAQGVALTLTPAAAYGAYVFGWDATTGHNLDPAVSWSATAGFAALGVSTVVWETLLLTKRPKRRGEIEAAAERVAEDKAVRD